MRLSGVRCSFGIPGEARCESDGVGRYDESWPAEVTHPTQWPDLNLRRKEGSETVNLKTAGYRRTDGKKAVLYKEGDDPCAGRSGGAHFKGGSDMMSEEFATQGRLAGKLCREHLEYH